jgi:hypothetical protein
MLLNTSGKGASMMDKHHPATGTQSLMIQVILLQSKAETSDEDLAAFFKGVVALKQHISCLVAVVFANQQKDHPTGCATSLHFVEKYSNRLYIRILLFSLVSRLFSISTN